MRALRTQEEGMTGTDAVNAGCEAIACGAMASTRQKQGRAGAAESRDGGVCEGRAVSSSGVELKLSGC